MRTYRNGNTVTITGSTTSWASRGYTLDHSTILVHKQRWHRQFDDEDTAEVECQNLLAEDNATYMANETARIEREATEAQRAAVTTQRQTNHGRTFTAEYANDESCIHCGMEIGRGQQVRYYYGMSDARSLVHADCEQSDTFSMSAPMTDQAPF